MTRAQSDDGIAELLGYLRSRFSVGPKWLGPPVPTPEQWTVAAATALRAPDHGHLVPFRFTVIADDQRAPLARLFEQAARRRGHGPDEAAEDGRRAYRGPGLVALIARIDPAHPKVPVHEQWICVGAALMNFMNALHLMGFGAKVLSGRKVTDPVIAHAFCASGETLVGWVLAGTPTAAAHPREADDPAAVIGPWRPPSE